MDTLILEQIDVIWNCFAAFVVLIISQMILFQDYSEMSIAYRPSHADATYDMKYGVRAVQVTCFPLGV